MSMNFVRTVDGEITDEQVVVFWMANDSSDNHYKICTNSEMFRHLNKIYVNNDDVAKTISEIANSVRKERAKAIFFPESDLI